MSSPIRVSRPTPNLGKGEPAYLIGRDNQGHWVAFETHGLGGGWFASREAAAGFAAFETGHRPGAVRLVDEPVALRL